MAIRRIAGQRGSNAISRFKGGKERQNEAGRRAGGDNNAGWIDIESVPFPISARDTPAQRCNAKGFGLTEGPGSQRSARGGNRRRRRSRRRLADFHVNDFAALRFKARRRGNDIHHHERRDRAAHRWLQKIPGPLKHYAASNDLLPESNRPGAAVFTEFSSIRRSPCNKPASC